MGSCKDGWCWTRGRFRQTLGSSALILCAGLAATVWAGPGKDSDDTLALRMALAERAQKIQSYRANLSMRVREASGWSTVEGTVLFKDPRKLRLELVVNGDDLRRQMTICDGSTLWQVLPSQSRCVKMALGSSQANLHNQFGDLRSAFRDLDASSIRLAGTAKIGGVETQVFEGDSNLPPSLRAQSPFQKIRVWVGLEDGLARRLVAYDGKGQETLVQEYARLERNVPIDESSFNYVPPSGMTVDTR